MSVILALTKNKKCPISRTNIVNFDTLSLYQNVSYKMSLCYRIDTKRHPTSKTKRLLDKLNILALQNKKKGAII